MEWLEKEQKKDRLEIDTHKTKMIEDLKKIDKSKMFVKPEKKKISVIDKILKIFGYGRKR
jgi:hypothetical protein